MSHKKIGVLMLDIDIPRPKGDIGHVETFDFPVEYKIVAGASTERVVKEGDSKLIEPFIRAAKELADEGIQAVTTSCGFLALFQKEIAQKADVPFYSSSLIQIPLVYHMTGGPIGVITARKASLTQNHLKGVHAENIPLIIEGMDHQPEFTSTIVEATKKEIDTSVVEKEVLEVGQSMIQNNPDIKAIVLECTNLPPYSKRLKEVLGVPIFDIKTLTEYIYHSLP